MAANKDPIFPLTAVIGIASLVSPAPITSRANIAGTTGLTQLTPVSTNGKRVDRIHVHAKETTVAGCVFIWMYNGTTSYLIDEVVVTAVTASNTAAAFDSYRDYDTLVLPATHQLYVSSTVDQDFNIMAYGGDY